MTPILIFVLVALRAIIELIVWLIVGRAALMLLAGGASANNPIIRLFDVVLKPPRVLAARLTPGASFAGREWVLFGLLLSLCLALGLGKWWLLR